jgi:prepilin-type N-terminal cleavage/methylation domain-containing protein
MTGKKGFTLLEIIVVMIIIGILAAIALFNFRTSIEQTRAQTAQNNLMAIAAGQEKYYEDHGYYSNLSRADLFAALNLSPSSNDPFFNNYTCTVVAACNPASIPYSCTVATPYNCTTNDGTDYLKLTYATPTAGTGGAVITCCDVNNNTSSLCPPNLLCPAPSSTL